MAKLTKKQITTALEGLRTDLVSEQNTRPAGVNDKNPPYKVTSHAVKQLVTKKMKDLEARSNADLADMAKRELQGWNNYLVFAFDPKESDPEFYTAHKHDISYVVGQCQKGIAKGQLDRQLIWRARELEAVPAAKPTGEREAEVAAPADPMAVMAGIYTDTAIAHNVNFIHGTIGNKLKQCRRTDIDAKELAADAIVNIKHHLPGYDPIRSAFSTITSKPIGWAVLKALNGNAHDRFDDKMEGLSTGYAEQAARDERDAMDGLDFADEENGRTIMQRLRRAARNLSGRARKVFDYKFEHPDATLEEVGKECGGCSKENVRQALGQVAKEIPRIDPELTRYVRGMINGYEDEVDHERLSIKYEPSLLQQQAANVLEIVEHDIAAMKEELGPDTIAEVNGKLVFSKVQAAEKNGRPGRPGVDAKRRELIDNLKATHDVAKILDVIVNSPYVDAGFDVLSLGQIRALAFYPGGSGTLEMFVENNIEAMAKAGREMIIQDCPPDPKNEGERKDSAQMIKARKIVDLFSTGSADELAAFKKSDINMLFCAPESSDGDVLNKTDLLMVRKMGVAAAKKQPIVVTL